MSSSYITPIEYQRGATGQETASLVSNVTKLSASVALGATSLPISPATTKDVAVDDRMVIFDGSNTEEVRVTGAATAPVSSIAVSALQYAHSKYTALCGDGALGSLADQILAASDMVEDECLQSLLLDTRTDTLSLQTMRAAIGNTGVLVLRPMSFPVQSVTSLVVNTPGATIALDTSLYAFLDSRQQLVTFYQLIPSAIVPFGSPFQTMLNQRTAGTVTLTYTSGFAYSSMPPRVKKACALYVSDLLSKRINPSGAVEVQQGKRRLKWGHIGDTSGESDLVKEARSLLSSFKQEMF